MGSRVIAPEYKDRATVMMDEHGSTLTIGIAKAEDRGLYKCSVAVRGDQPEVKHQVRIRGQSVSQSGGRKVEIIFKFQLRRQSTRQARPWWR